jgi:hypothetical protein
MKAMTDKRVQYGILGALLLVAMTGCSSAVDAVCQVQGTGTGGYVVKFTRVGSASSPACDVQAKTPAGFSDVWVIEQYGRASDGAIAMTSVQMAPPDTSQPNATIYSKGKFNAIYPDSSQLCTVPTMTDMTDLGGAAVLQYSALTMQFLSTAYYQGTQFKGTVTVTRGGCTANYTTQGLSPTVGCTAGGNDCDPFRKPLNSGIQSNYNQGCVTDSWTTEATAFLGPADGVCFLKAEFPSLGSYSP